jgi:pectinesterase
MRFLTIYFFVCFVPLLCGQSIIAQTSHRAVKKIIVSQDGKGDFKTIQGAINSLSDSADMPRIIFIRNGTYKEKIYLEKHNIVFEGEDRDKTILTASIARDEWRCLHNEDWGVATLNIDGNDITLKNMTITNSYGFEWVKDEIIYCASDTVSKQKTIGRSSHQMAIRTMNATRLRAINCRFKAFGGDTVSPWNVENGLFYFKDCIMEGGVDFYCPRGWAYAENCTFIAHSGTAAIWHDGSKYEDSKTVLKNCRFDGFDGFNLGRFHRDAQFYLINCQFGSTMADRDIYLVPTTNTIRWGRRIYYFNCHRNNGDYGWHGDNLMSAPGNPDPTKINAQWVFGKKWNPLANSTENK